MADRVHAKKKRGEVQFKPQPKNNKQLTCSQEAAACAARTAIQQRLLQPAPAAAAAPGAATAVAAPAAALLCYCLQRRALQPGLPGAAAAAAGREGSGGCEEDGSDELWGVFWHKGRLVSGWVVQIATLLQRPTLLHNTPAPPTRPRTITVTPRVITRNSST